MTKLGSIVDHRIDLIVRGGARGQTWHIKSKNCPPPSPPGYLSPHFPMSYILLPPRCQVGLQTTCWSYVNFFPCLPSCSQISDKYKSEIKTNTFDMQKDKTTVHFLWITPSIYIWNNIDIWKYPVTFHNFFFLSIISWSRNHAGDNLHK